MGDSITKIDQSTVEDLTNNSINNSGNGFINLNISNSTINGGININIEQNFKGRLNLV